MLHSGRWDWLRAPEIPSHRTRPCRSRVFLVPDGLPLLLDQGVQILFGHSAPSEVLGEWRHHLLERRSAPTELLLKEADDKLCTILTAPLGQSVDRAGQIR